MKKSIQIVVMAIIALIACSCSEKSSAISQLESFTKELEKNSDDYGVKDWIKAEKKYNEIIDRLDKCKDDLTEKEKRKVIELNEECAKYYAAGLVNLQKEGMEAAGNLMESVGDMAESVNDLMENSDKTMEKLEDLYQ